MSTNTQPADPAIDRALVLFAKERENELLVEIARLRACLTIIAEPMRPDGHYRHERATCGEFARQALAGTQPATSKP